MQSKCVNGNNSVMIKSEKSLQSYQSIQKEYDHTNKNQYPVARWKHAAVIYENYLYIMGGYTWTNTLKDLWRLNLNALNKAMADQFKPMSAWEPINDLDRNIILWQNLSNFNGKISPLQSHTMIAYKKQLFIFGGAFTYDIRNCPFWIYNIDNQTMKKWKPENPNSLIPIPRRNHSCSIYRNVMVIFGGFGDIRGSLGDLWAFDFGTEKWHSIWTAQNSIKTNRHDCFRYGPRGRHDHRAVVHKNSLFIFGGMNGLEMCNDLWQWNFDEFQWTRLMFKGTQEDISYMIDTKVSNYWLIFAINDSKKRTEKWIYSFNENKWITSTCNIPEMQPFCTLLIFNTNNNNDIFSQKPIKNRSKLNRIYPITEDFPNMFESSAFESIRLQSCCTSKALEPSRLSDNYKKLGSFNTLSNETILTDLTDNNQSETTFSYSESGEVLFECCDRELLIILGNNIEKASFDRSLNMQFFYL